MSLYGKVYPLLICPLLLWLGLGNKAMVLAHHRPAPTIRWGDHLWVVYTSPGECPQASNSRVLKFTASPGIRGSADPKAVERNEIFSWEKWQYGQDVWVSFEEKIDQGDPITSKWVLVGQLHQTANLAEKHIHPIFAQQILDGHQFQVVARSSTESFMTRNANDTVLYQEDDIHRGTWVQWKYHFRIVRGSGSGLIDGWRNGRKVIHYEGSVGYNQPVGPYFQLGVYRDAAPEPLTVEYRNFHMSFGSTR